MLLVPLETEFWWQKATLLIERVLIDVLYEANTRLPIWRLFDFPSLAAQGAATENHLVLYVLQ